MKRNILYPVCFGILFMSYFIYQYQNEPRMKIRYAADKIAKEKSALASITNAEVLTAGEALNIAETSLLKKFSQNIVDKQKPFAVNLVDGVWIIEGAPENLEKGRIHIEMQKETGKMIYTWQIMK